MSHLKGQRKEASPYATGGGGVSLERSFGATLLSAMLTGDPIAGLGDEQTVVAVRFQASIAESPVDDFVVSGEARQRQGVSRRISMAVRRDPTIGPSDPKFVKLINSYIRVLLQHQVEMEADTWRLGLVVAGDRTGPGEASELADFARAHASNPSFREIIGRPNAVRGDLRNRLRLLDQAVVAAIAGDPTTAVDPSEMSWRLLRSLRVLVPRLEGDDATDRTTAVAQLREMVPDHSPGAAETLFRTLADFAGQFAVKGSQIDEGTLRRTLVGRVVLARSRSYPDAWTKLESCEERLRTRTRMSLTRNAESAPDFVLPRTEQMGSVAEVLRDVGKACGTTIITGAPDVGKSSLTLRVVDLLRAESIPVVLLGLRDLPATPSALESLLGVPVSSVLIGGPVGPSRVVVLDGAEVVLEGGAALLSYFVRAALKSGFGVAAITRDDAQSAVFDVLREASLTSATAAPRSLEVAGLSEAEVEQIATAFPALSHIAAERRARGLLRRPGLVEALLRSGAHAELPSGSLSEADVYAAFWKHAVRHNEVSEPGMAGPDSREDALLGLARRLLRLDVPASDKSALPSLRSEAIDGGQPMSERALHAVARAGSWVAQRAAFNAQAVSTARASST